MLYVTNLNSSGAEQSQGTCNRHNMTMINLQHGRKKSLSGLKEKEDVSFRTDLWISPKKQQQQSQSKTPPTQDHETKFYSYNATFPNLF